MSRHHAAQALILVLIALAGCQGPSTGPEERSAAPTRGEVVISGHVRTSTGDVPTLAHVYVGTPSFLGLRSLLDCTTEDPRVAVSDCTVFSRFDDQTGIIHQLTFSFGDLGFFPPALELNSLIYGEPRATKWSPNNLGMTGCVSLRSAYLTSF